MISVAVASGSGSVISAAGSGSTFGSSSLAPTSDSRAFSPPDPSAPVPSLAASPAASLAPDPRSSNPTLRAMSQNARCTPAYGIFHPQKYDLTFAFLNASVCASCTALTTSASAQPSRESRCVASDHSETAASRTPAPSAAWRSCPTLAEMKSNTPRYASSRDASQLHAPGAGNSHARYMCTSSATHAARSASVKCSAIHAAISYTFIPLVSMKLTNSVGGGAGLVSTTSRL